MMLPTPARVLIVDDELDMRDLLSDVLTRQGLHVQSAATGAEAIALADRNQPDLLVADMGLPDCTGLDVIDRLRARMGDVPALLITGNADVHSASEATRRGCVDFLTKPLDLPRLREAVSRELTRQGREDRSARRTRQFRHLARELNRRRHEMKRQLNTTCAALTTAYRTLNRQLGRQEALIRFQRFLLTCQTDDDIFRGLFRFFTERTGPVFGLALVCDDQAKLQLVGRFGAPEPDAMELCHQIAASVSGLVLDNPSVMRLEIDKHKSIFSPSLRKQMPGVTFMCLPLLPTEGRLIGLVVLYRKGEQPFTDDDLAIGEMLAPTIAVAIQCNDPE